MKKYLFIIFCLCLQVSMFSQTIITTRSDSAALYQPKSDIITTRAEEAVLLKPTIFNTARFLRYQGGPIVLDRGMQMAVPGLTHTFYLPKNTLVLISETVAFSTTSCVLCPEASFFVWVYIDDQVFARLSFQGADKSMTLSGSALAQLGPGTHTIRLDVGGTSNTGDITIYGSNGRPVNYTHMSLLFFPEE